MRRRYDDEKRRSFIDDTGRKRRGRSKRKRKRRKEFCVIINMMTCLNRQYYIASTLNVRWVCYIYRNSFNMDFVPLSIYYNRYIV